MTSEIRPEKELHAGTCHGNKRGLEIWKLLKQLRRWKPKFNSDVQNFNHHFCKALTTPPFPLPLSFSMRSLVFLRTQFWKLCLVKNTQCCGPDLHSLLLFKACVPHLGALLSKMFGIRLTTATIPRCWKPIRIRSILMNEWNKQRSLACSSVL